MMMRKSATNTNDGRRLRRNLPSPPPSSARRNLRPRRCRPPISDDFISSSDEEDEPTRGKRKLKLVLKLPAAAPVRPLPRLSDSSEISDSEAPTPHSSPSARSFGRDDEDEEEEQVKPVKKRKIGGSGRREETRKNAVSKTTNWVPGACNGSRKGTKLPDKKLLETVLDKLQKKDTYSVFAQPVDPEELPDYHDVIGHPMDFGTIRKKLGRNAYSCFEQFEDDVFLICSNAMQYNAPDTIYFRQARSIQEMATKKFQMLRTDGEQKQQTFGTPASVRSESKSEEKVRSCPKDKKLIKKTMYVASQEPVGSDIASGVSLASALENCTTLKTLETSEAKRPAIVSGSLDGATSLGESKTEKADEISASDSPSKLGQKVPVVDEDCGATDNTSKEEPMVESDSVLTAPTKCSPHQLGPKPLIVDENRRATYAIHDDETMLEPDSIFTVFESETKLLAMVGHHEDYSYARSLARFAGLLGPVAWRIASEKIEKALPAGIKFGPGWVGEYEPPPTPILYVENPAMQQQELNLDSEYRTRLRKHRENEERTQSKQNGGFKDTQIGCRTNVVLPVPIPSVEKHTLQELGLNPKSERRTTLRNDGENDKTIQSMQNGGPKWMHIGRKTHSVLPTPILSAEKPTIQQLGLNSKSECRTALRKERENEERIQSTQNGGCKDMQIGHRTNVVGGKCNGSSDLVKGGTYYQGVTAGKQEFSIASERKPNFTFAMLQEQKDRLAVDLARTYTNATEHLRACNSSSGISAETALQMPFNNSESATSRSLEMIFRNKSHMQPEPPKQHETTKSECRNAIPVIDLNGSSGGNVKENSGNDRWNTPLSLVPNHLMKVGDNGALHGTQKQVIDHSCRGTGLSGKSFYPPNMNVAVHDPKQVKSPIQQPRREHPSAAAAAAQAWMSIGTPTDHRPVDGAGLAKAQQVGPASFYNSFWKIPAPATGFNEDSKAKHLSPILPQPIRVNEEFQVKNQGFLIFPQLVGSDSPRLHAQSPQQCLVSHSQQRHRTDTLPPDLNISFQPPGSPALHSSGILMDSQQPDLALQL